MIIPPLAFKIAVQLIENQLAPQATEPADLSPIASTTSPYQSVLALLGKQNATATEPAPKVITDTGRLTK